MSKLVLHIGTHKTASTSIQDSCGLNRELMARHGLVYPKLKNGHHGLLMDWLYLPEAYRLGESALPHWRHIAEAHADSDRVVLISSEEMSRGDEKNRVDFGAILECVGAFDELEVVCFLRDQVSFLQSIYLQITRRSPGTPWWPFVPKALETKLADGVFLDYTMLADFLLKFFPKTQITFITFREAVAHPFGPTGRLLEQVGFGALSSDMKIVRSNTSHDPLSFWLAGMLVKPKPPSPALVEHIRGKIIARFGKRKTTIFNRREIEAIQQNATAWNASFAALAPEVALSDLNFDLAKLDTLVTRDSLNEGFWIDTIRSGAHLLQT